MATNPVDPYAQIYRSVQRREQTQQRAFSGTSLEQAMQDERDNQIRLGIIAAPPPDAVAKATKIARDTDVAPGEVDGNLASAEKMQQANRMTAVLGKYPAFTRFAQSNPRAVAAAADDHKALGILGDAWDYLNSMGNAVDATWRVQGSKVNAGLADFVGEAYDTLTSIAQPGRETVGQAEARKAARTTYWRGGVNTAENARKAAMPKTDSYVLGQVNEGIANLGPSLFAAVAGAVTRSPQLTMALMGAQTGIPAYTDARYANKGVVDSVRYGFVQGLIEVATEKIPAMSLVDDIVKRTPIGKTIIRQLGQEIPGEQVATILQDFSTWATLNPEKPFSAYVAERPQAALDTLIQTAVGTTAQTSLTVAVDRTVQSAAKVAGRVVQAREAKQTESFLDRVERAAAESKLRGRDPEAYADMVEQTANDSGVGQVFIPAEAIRAFQQSDSYDQFDDPFADYQAQIDEAYEVGGDVVLPAGFALGTLPGTPAWAAVKADMRLAPGGMSAREADDLSSQLDDIMGELTDQAYQRDADQQGERDARGQIVERVSAMLQNAGFTPANARMQAELIAQRESSRASRMGRELTGAEFGTEVVSVLPPALAEIQKADGLDLVVNALRKGKPATKQRGKSLLEWIAARGGVEDVGGDIASMGADRWHMLDKAVTGKNKNGKAFTAKVIPGRRKLIKPNNVAQGSMIGGEFNPNTLENTLDAAISEGFFPDLLAQRETGEGYADKIDTGVLLAAIADELAGRSTYAEEATTDNVRAAAAELEQMLAERGLVASELTDAEIRAAVGQMEQEGSGASPNGVFVISDPIGGEGSETVRVVTHSRSGSVAIVREGGEIIEIGNMLDAGFTVERAIAQSLGEDVSGDNVTREGSGGVIYDQLPDSIDIDGVARPTRNSEGMPLAGSEEGLRAFWKWFGDSKVVDEEGRPLVVYHGTGDEFEAFDVSRAGENYASDTAGIFLTSDRVLAEGYARQAADAGDGVVIDAYARVENPLEVVARDDDPTEIWFRNRVAYKNQMADGGHDGVIVKNADGEMMVVVRDPTQIKSINNRGTFDPADARILYQVSPQQAMETNVPVEMPNDPLFSEAVGNTPGALVTPNGLVMDLVRFQKPEQEGAEAVRTGVFYLPAQSADVRHYRNAKTGYGGKDRFAGPTLIRRPLFVKGATGGAAPEQAFRTIKGKEAFDAMSRSVTQVITRGGNYMRPDRSLKVQLIEEFIDQYAPEQSGYGDFIESVSREGNTLRYALQELAVAHAVREAGYDAIVSYSKGKAGAKISEVFDVREQTFPARGMESQIHDAYYQAYGEGARGRILMDGNRPFRIELFQERNLSTLLHELSHQWLEELRADAENPDAPEQVKADWQAVTEWFAANGNPIVDGVIPVEAHEMWARGGERYIMEGKAPSPALTGLFETFRGWLLSIYKTVQALRAPITPEIREVFDRLLATDEEIAAMAEMQALQPMFKDAAAIGMTGQEFEAYKAQAQAARDEANSTLLAKTMAAIRRRETKKFRDEKRAVMADEAERLNDEPLLKSIRLMQATPIDQEWLVDRMGLDVLSLLPKRVPPLWRERGVNPDSLAELAGFGSGQQMIEVLIGAERQHRQAREGGDQRTMRARMIENAADAEMTLRYGDDPLNDGSIEQEAIAAVNGELQGELLASEVRLLSRRTGQRPTPYKIARQWARNRVRTGLVSIEASPGAIQRHARNVAKAGRDAEKAMLAGKMDEALRFKQQQMLSSALLAEAKDASDEVNAAVKRMGKIAKRATMKSVDQDYLEQAHALLEAVDLKERTQKSENRKKSFQDWAAAREAEGFEVVVPPSFEATLGKTNWSRLPVETLLGLDEAVAQVMHLGRFKQSLLDRQDQREWDEIFQEAENAGGNIDGPPPKDMTDPGWWGALKGRILGADAALLKMETVFDWLDGGDSNGVFNRIVFRPIADAQSREQDMQKDYMGRIKALFEAVPAEVGARWQDKMELPFVDPLTGMPMRMNRHKVIAMALNVGNEGNLQRLSDGYRINPGALTDYLNATLTAEEWQFVQGVWDTIDTLWPEIARIEREVNGVAPDKVDAREVVTPFGPLRGGYYPAVYDTTRDYKAEENKGRESDLFEGAYTRATTRASSTKERAEAVKRPILLDLGVINRHLGEVIHDITHREAVIRANRFLTNERVMRTIDAALGPEIRKQLRPWLKFVANSWAIERAGNEGFGKFIGQLRANATVVGMGLRATTMVTQIAGYSNSVEVVGEAAMAKALAQFYANPRGSISWVMENSDEVRNRMDTLDRDIRTELTRLNNITATSKAMQVVLDSKKFVFHGIGYMDRLVSVPTWIAGYNNALAAGMDEADARYAGDKAVRQSQGAGGPKDLAAIQRGTGNWGEALKLFTMFYSYFSAQYQRQRTLARDITGDDTRRPRNMPKLAARAFFLMALPPMLVELLRGVVGAPSGPDDEEWWAQWLMRKLLANALGPIPLARDVFEPTWNAIAGNRVFNPSVSPIQRAYDSVVKVGRDVGKLAEGEDTKSATKDVLELVGYSTGLVPGQVASATQFLVDVSSGDADPQGFWDWAEGLSTGKLKD